MWSYYFCISASNKDVCKCITSLYFILFPFKELVFSLHCKRISWVQLILMGSFSIGGEYNMRTVPGLDTSPTDISPNRQFPDWILVQRRLPWPDISPLRHFPDRTFTRPEISLTIYLVRYFILNLFQIYFYLFLLHSLFLMSCRRSI